MILNVGSLCIDHVYTVPQLSAAGHTIASSDYQIFPGGKGLNQSLAAACAGAQVSHFGCVGDDGGMLLDTLRSAGVDTSAISQLTGASGHAVIQVDQHGQNAIVIHGGTNRCLSLHAIAEAVHELRRDDWLLLQNEVNDLPGILAIAGQASCSVALNVAPADAQCRALDLSNVDVLVVNEQEAQVLSGAATEVDALDWLQSQNPSQTIVLTRGKHGLLWAAAQDGGELAAFSVVSVDETAAGDAFVGYLMASLAAAEPMEPALLRASAAGALATTQSGAASSIPTADLVHEMLSQQVST